MRSFFLTQVLIPQNYPIKTAFDASCKFCYVVSIFICFKILFKFSFSFLFQPIGCTVVCCLISTFCEFSSFLPAIDFHFVPLHSAKIHGMISNAPTSQSSAHISALDGVRKKWVSSLCSTQLRSQVLTHMLLFFHMRVFLLALGCTFQGRDDAGKVKLFLPTPSFHLIGDFFPLKYARNSPRDCQTFTKALSNMDDCQNQCTWGRWQKTLNSPFCPLLLVCTDHEDHPEVKAYMLFGVF